MIFVSETTTHQLLMHWDCRSVWPPSKNQLTNSTFKDALFLHCIPNCTMLQNILSFSLVVCNRNVFFFLYKWQPTENEMNSEMVWGKLSSLHVYSVHWYLGLLFWKRKKQHVVCCWSLLVSGHCWSPVIAGYADYVDWCISNKMCQHQRN